MTGTLRQFVVVSALLHSAVFGYLWHTRPLATTTTAPHIEIALAGSDTRARDALSMRPTPPRVMPPAETPRVQQRALAQTDAHAVTTSRPRTMRTVNAQRNAASNNDAGANLATTHVTANARPSQAPPATARAQVLAHLRTALDRYFSYPLLARRHGWQGLVELRLRVEPNGRLSHIELARSSGHAVLDQAALDSTRSIITVGDTAGHLHGTSVDLLLPVEYRLIDG